MRFLIQHLKKSYENKVVLQDIDFAFEEGKIYGLLGRNGAGKTTLFNCINHDIDFDEGSFGIECEKGTQKVEPEDIGYVLSTPTVPEFLTGKEFLKFFLDMNQKRIHNLKSIDEYFDMVGIAKDDQDKLLREYSHGMKNKMQMLVNFLSEPKLLLLDEPLTSLDVVAAEEMKGILRAEKEKRITILSTHIMDLALDICDEIVLLSKGELRLLPKNPTDREAFREEIMEALRDEQDEE